MKLVILDIVSKNYKDLDNNLSTFDNAIVLSLSPSSCYYLDKNSIQYISFHGLISTKDFRDEFLSIFFDILKNNEEIYQRGFLREVSQYISQLLFVEKIITYIKKHNYTSTIYITDKKSNWDSSSISNENSILSYFFEFSKVIKIKKDILKIKITLLDKLRQCSFIRIKDKIKDKIVKNNLKYDWDLIDPKVKKYDIEIDNRTFQFNISHQKLKHTNMNELNFNIKNETTQYTNYLTFLEKDDYIKVIELIKKNKELFFYQHGSYLYKNLFIRYSEIEVANINFVFNDYTKKFFEEMGSKKVYSVGSILFNKKIKEKKKEFDFLYITQGHDYLGNIQYVDFPNSLHSFDGYELYQRHKEVIELFGQKLINKRIIIRVHPCIVSSGVYVPLWELAEQYKNITIDVKTSIHTIIEKSNYIISDYFTSEFINRDVHYKRDIILFDSAPTPIAETIYQDMQKMFLLVSDVCDLKTTVQNIEDVTNNRKRYDNIIEYYSSKKCDTKKLVTKILEQE